MGKVLVKSVAALSEVRRSGKLNLATGENSTHFDSDEWPRGIYHIRIISDDADSFENTVILN